jgi:tRNA (Thr-GGU) A37 N-methylase
MSWSRSPAWLSSHIDGSIRLVSELDAINGTPVLDIKPVLLEFLPRDAVRQPPWSRELMSAYWKRKT